jgi:3-(3-hydroxy-phenyl)propionate hydroxylase
MPQTTLTDGTLYDVAIVGFGPVGATLAALLGRRGHRVIAFDKSTEIFPLPRAIGLDHEALRVLQAIGNVDALIPHTAPYRPSVYLGCDGKPILRFDIGPPPFPLGWRPNYTFNQPKLEEWLRESAQFTPNVDVGLGAEVTSLEERADEVVLTLADRSTVAAKYIVGCDGAASLVRRAGKIGVEDLQFDERWLVIDLLLDDEAAATLPDTNIQYCDPQRPSTYVVLPKNHRRWEIMLNAGEDAEEMSRPNSIWALLAGRISPDHATLWRAAVYRFHAIVAQRWRFGRCFLAGDSAHQMPPFLAQGMCQGIRDAANLEWKLDLVLRGRAVSSLLDSYEAERKPNVIEVTNVVKQLGKLICERDPVAARRRDAEVRQSQGGVIETKTRQDLIPGLKAGIVSRKSKAAGLMFPQPIVRTRDGGSAMLDNLTGTRFRIVTFAAEQIGQMDSIDRFINEFDSVLLELGPDGLLSIGDAVRATDGSRQLSAWLAKHECIAAIVRPDGYVFGTAKNLEEIDTSLAELTSQLNPPKTELRARS